MHSTRRGLRCRSHCVRLSGRGCCPWTRSAEWTPHPPVASTTRWRVTRTSCVRPRRRGDWNAGRAGLRGGVRHRCSCFSSTNAPRGPDASASGGIVRGGGLGAGEVGFSSAGGGGDGGVWTAKTVKRPRQQPAHPQYANYWAPLTRKRHTMPHSAQSQHTNYWAPRTRKRHQQEYRPQRPTESSDPTQHAKGRTGDCPGPRKETTTRRSVTRGGALAANSSGPPLVDGGSTGGGGSSDRTVKLELCVRHSVG